MLRAVMTCAAIYAQRDRSSCLCEHERRPPPDPDLRPALERGGGRPDDIGLTAVGAPNAEIAMPCGKHKVIVGR